MKTKFRYFLIPALFLLTACYPPHYKIDISYEVSIINESEHNIFIQFYFMSYDTRLLETLRYTINSDETAPYYRIADYFDHPKDNLIKFIILDTDTRKVLKRVDNDDMEDLFIFESAEDHTLMRWREEYYTFTVTEEWLNS